MASDAPLILGPVILFKGGRCRAYVFAEYAQRVDSMGRCKRHWRNGPTGRPIALIEGTYQSHNPQWDFFKIL